MTWLLAVAVAVVVIAVLAWFGFAVLREYERGVVFRAGRLRPVYQPGIRFLLPGLEERLGQWVDALASGRGFVLLRRFPVDVLKIDRTFIAGLDRDDEDAAIVAAVIGLAQTLELTAIAEGVETPEQARRLRALGCEAAQGFHFARPVPAPPDPGELRRVRLEYQCPICSTTVRMTMANDEMPEPPRHCMEDMELITPIEDL